MELTNCYVQDMEQGWFIASEWLIPASPIDTVYFNTHSSYLADQCAAMNTVRRDTILARNNR